MSSDKLGRFFCPELPISSDRPDRSCAGTEPASKEHVSLAKTISSFDIADTKVVLLTVTGRAQRSMHIVHFKLSSNIAGCV